MKNKGVTLIALAVTIVVMLILAGVTISVLNGENGIVKQAQKAKEESKIKELKEKVRIDIAGKRVENINGELRVSVLKEILDKYFDNVPVETQITSETELKAKEEYGKYEMKISDIDVGEITYETSYTIFKDVNGEQVPIPEGYIVSENSDENIVNKGLVVSDSRGNEYVWISCTVDSSSNKLQYKRAASEKEAAQTVGFLYAAFPGSLACLPKWAFRQLHGAYILWCYYITTQYICQHIN